MRHAFLLSTLLLAAALAGCAGSDTGPTSATTYNVPVKAAHNSDTDRTITLKVSQDGQSLGEGAYRTGSVAASSGSTVETYDFRTLFSIEAEGGALKIQAFEGSNPLNFKSIDPARCGNADFLVHVTDDAVHLFSSCD